MSFLSFLSPLQTWSICSTLKACKRSQKLEFEDFKKYESSSSGTNSSDPMKYVENANTPPKSLCFKCLHTFYFLKRFLQVTSENHSSFGQNVLNVLEVIKKTFICKNEDECPMILDKVATVAFEQLLTNSKFSYLCGLIKFCDPILVQSETDLDVNDLGNTLLRFFGVTN